MDQREVALNRRHIEANVAVVPDSDHGADVLPNHELACRGVREPDPGLDALWRVNDTLGGSHCGWVGGE